MLARDGPGAPGVTPGLVWPVGGPWGWTGTVAVEAGPDGFAPPVPVPPVAPAAAPPAPPPPAPPPAPCAKAWGASVIPVVSNRAITNERMVSSDPGGNPSNGERVPDERRSTGRHGFQNYHDAAVRLPRAARSRRPLLAPDLGAGHDASRAGVERIAPMHRAAIVPQHQVADPPCMLPGELGTRHVGP